MNGTVGHMSRQVPPFATSHQEQRGRCAEGEISSSCCVCFIREWVNLFFSCKRAIDSQRSCLQINGIRRQRCNFRWPEPLQQQQTQKEFISRSLRCVGLLQ